MRLGIISDIHIDINMDYPIIDEMIIQINNKKIDVLLIAGDISENVNTTLDAIKSLESHTNAKIYFVPGNHDMWGKDFGTKETKKVYDTFKNHPNCLCEKSVLLSKDIQLIGNVGWYDYSFGDEKFSFEEFETMKHNDRTWQDKLFNTWTNDNASTNRWQMDLLQKAYDEHRGLKTILVTHMLSHEKFTVPLDWSEKIEWGFFNAFLGSKSLKTFCERNKIAISIMGHVHYRGVVKDNDTTYICSCLNYHTEWQSNDYKNEIANAIYIMDL